MGLRPGETVRSEIAAAVSVAMKKYPLVAKWRYPLVTLRRPGAGLRAGPRRRGQSAHR